MPLTIAVSSPEQTLAVGRALGRCLGPGAVVLLVGDLGAGKTLMTRGIAEGLGIADPARVVSPTFAIVNRYDGALPIAHVDLYRLADARAVEVLWDDEELPAARGVTIVEWGERLPGVPPGAVRVAVAITGEEAREIAVDGAPPGFAPPAGT